MTFIKHMQRKQFLIFEGAEHYFWTKSALCKVILEKKEGKINNIINNW